MDFEKLKEVRRIGFVKEVGVNFLELSEGYAKSELIIEPKHKNPIGSVHGGVIFTLADTTAGSASVSRGRYATTMSGNVSFLRPAIDCKKLIAEAREIKVGKQVCIYEVMVTDENGKEIALTTFTFHYIEKVAGEDFMKEIRTDKTE